MHAVAKPSIVILHGANGTAGTMRPLVDALRAYADPIALNLLGHGGRDVPERVTFELLAADVIAQMDERGLQRAYLFGYSTGGALALYLARHFPERFFGVTTLAAKYVFDKRTLEHWMHLTEPDRLERVGRAQALRVDHHPQDWKTVTLAIRATFLELAKNPPLSEADLRAIAMPALLFFSNEDQIVPFEESMRLGRLLPSAKPVIFHGQCHPLAVVPIAAMATAIGTWIGENEQRRSRRIIPGAKPAIVILHGANATAKLMKPLADEIATCAEAFAPNLPGHGGREIPERMSVESFAADVIAQMDARNLRRVYLFGYSSGGTLALYLARHFAERFIGVATLAAKYVFDAQTVAHWTHLTSVERVERPGSKRPEALTRDHHPQDWKQVLHALRAMFFELGEKPPLSQSDLRAISLPALLFSSEQDQIVTLDETRAIGELVRGSKIVSFPGYSHPLNVVPIAVIGDAICDWICSVEETNAASV